jgi:hypothetical protein
MTRVHDGGAPRTTAACLAITTTLLTAGCATGAEPAAAPLGNVPPTTDVAAISAGPGSSHFIIRMPGEPNIEVLVEDRSITGPGFSLTRYDDASDHAIRGDAVRLKVNVDVTADGANGLYGGGPFDVKVAMVGDELQVHGVVSGKPTLFAINPRAMSGNVGRCAFQMVRQDLQYVGTRGCGRGHSSAELVFPASFGRWSLPQLGAALALLLSSGS